MSLRPKLENGSVLTRALWGVSSSPPMPRYPEYVRAIEELGRGPISNPRPTELQASLSAIAGRCASTGPLELPWRSGPIPASRLLSALSSFTDDYGGPFPEEFFPSSRLSALLQRISAQYTREKTPRTLPEQFECALGVCSGSVMGAATTLHALTRLLARGRDTRALPAMTLSLEQRIALGRAIAPFASADSLGGDPLGDTYHYWGMFIGGLWCSEPRHSLSARLAVEAVLRNGSRLMWLVRERIFGSPLFFGRHAQIDQLGFRQGKALLCSRPWFAFLR